MLKPKRLTGNWLARRKTVKWELDRRFPARYTASNSPRRTSRASRGNSMRPGLLGREAMASLLAARRQNFAAAYGLHARAESVRLRAASFPRLKCALWQSNPPLSASCATADLPRMRPVLPANTKRPSSRLNGRYRIYKCSRPPRTGSRNPRIHGRNRAPQRWQAREEIHGDPASIPRSSVCADSARDRVTRR